MNQKILNWLNQSIGQTFQPDRPNAKPIKIENINDEKEFLRLKFVGGSTSLPLYFWMFQRAFNYIEKNKGQTIRLGAKVKPPFDSDTIEGQIWSEPYPQPPNTPFKSASHICDIFVLSGLAKYEKVRNPISGRDVQGVVRIDGPPIAAIITSDEVNSKEENMQRKFIAEYKDIIIGWAERNANEIIEARLRYSWKNKNVIDCVKERNDISKAIILSRIRNQGAVDLNTLDEIMRWGFNRDFPERDEIEVLKITKRAFSLLDDDNLIEATKTLLNVRNVGISRASKILGLFDQETLCVYDSRVGNALSDLRQYNRKIVLCPPGRNRVGDVVTNINEWAVHYQRLIWTLGIVRDYLNERGCTYRLADVEMALFMIGI